MRTLEVMRCIDRNRYQLHFCALSGEAGELDDEIHNLGGRVHLCKLNLTFPWRFRELLRKENIEVVHSDAYNFSGYILSLAAKEHIPIRIAHYHNTDDGKKNSLIRKVRRRIFKNLIDQYATHILAVSQATMSLSWNRDWKNDKRCQVVFNGFDFSCFNEQPDPIGVRGEFNLPANSRLFIHVGRLAPQKNHQRLIKIFKKVVEVIPNSYLLLVGQGDGGIEVLLRKIIARLGLEKQVVFTGVRSDVPRLLKASDMLLFPSLWEGLPGVVIESCAAGIPVLASDLPGVKEIAEHCPLVHYLPLSVADKSWAEYAKKILEIKEMKNDNSLRLNLSKGVFGIDTCAETYCNIWSGK